MITGIAAKKLAEPGPIGPLKTSKRGFQQFFENRGNKFRKPSDPIFKTLAGCKIHHKKYRFFKAEKFEHYSKIA